MPAKIERILLASVLLSLFVHAGALAQSLPDFTALVEQNVPAIVNVSTTRQSLMSDAEREYLGEFLRYFGDRLPEDFELPPPGQLEQGANGSGFIIAADGYIVTNQHVVSDADTITITLNDRREFQAELIGADPSSDLALLKIDAEGLPVVTLGDSSKLKVGEWVLAIGSPFGLRYSVTAGIISYMGRSIPTDGSNYVSYIQTDVAINPGHSGGPLLNLDGEVVGINSQIFTNSGGSIGLSFAIPMDVARNVLAQLKDHGSVQRGWLGVQYEDVDQSKAQAFGLDAPQGALINRVVEGSPAQQAGLEVGDIVVDFGGERIRTGDDLPYFVGLLMPGTEVALEIIRDGTPQVLTLTLGEFERQEISLTEPVEPDRLGLEVRELSEEEREAMGIEYGVMVLSADGAAARADIRQGDIILSINSINIGSPGALDRIASALPADKAIPVLVARDDEQRFFTLRIE